MSLDSGNKGLRERSHSEGVGNIERDSDFVDKALGHRRLVVPDSQCGRTAHEELRPSLLNRA